jgi:hypothetical protein
MREFKAQRQMNIQLGSTQNDARAIKVGRMIQI